MTDSKANDRILDSILSLNEIVLGSTAASAMGAMYTNIAQSTGLAAQNAVANQQHLNILAAAAVAAGSNCVIGSASRSEFDNMSPADRLDYLQKLINLAAGASPAVQDNSNSKAASSDTGSTDSADTDSAKKDPTSNDNAEGTATTDPGASTKPTS